MIVIENVYCTYCIAMMWMVMMMKIYIAPIEL